VISRAEARTRLPGLLLPRVVPEPPLHSPGGPTVSLVFKSGGKSVLLSEYGYGAGFIKKFAANGGKGVEFTDVGGAPAFWIPGGHDVFVPGTTPRLAGNVLVWERGAVTYRLEGRFLTKSAALELARSLRHD
jgi:hypothetical protein